MEHGDDPRYRIVLAGFDGEHGTALTDAGWREVEWFKKGHLKGGYAQRNKERGTQQHRERLWAVAVRTPGEDTYIEPHAVGDRRGGAPGAGTAAAPGGTGGGGGGGGGAAAGCVGGG